ncbi:gastrula-specific protein 17-like [Phyllobates terribilis]|uniref:gastrula-specific protein 17-like n=1 Tax=Phyllobates terribilis TaxID=111132 RepID=UPI003CCB028E
MRPTFSSKDFATHFKNKIAKQASIYPEILSPFGRSNLEIDLKTKDQQIAAQKRQNMSQQRRPPSFTGNQERVMSPYLAPTQRNRSSPKSWSSPQPSWQSRNWSPSQSNWSPQRYNSHCSPNGYWGSPQQWSPKQWEPEMNYQRSWGSTPKTPTFSPAYKQSPKHGSVFPEEKTQVDFRRNHKDISHYYRPSMVEDPWAELEAKATGSAAVST